MAKIKELIRFDWFVKFMLRDKADFEILSGFLSELMKEDVQVIDLLESEGNQTSKNDKFNRVDILVKTSVEELIIVEIQNDFQIDFLQRLLYGASKSTIEYIKKGEDYGSIKRIISVSIVYFDVGQGKDYVYYGSTNFVGIHEKDILQLSDDQKTGFQREFVSDLFPTYFLIRAEVFDGVIKDGLDEWVYFFKNGKIKDDFTAKGLDKAQEVLDYQKMDSDEKLKYENYYSNLREENSWARTRQSEIKSAEKTAKIEAKIEVAKEMKKEGESFAKIKKYTGLSDKEIGNL
jgi:predicted transposase/invertase (TIGR01784 family)